MGKIELLDQDVVNQIAAGEVVERPASVVKELMENAIDATATRITIEIKKAGLQEIKIIDNGIGMSAEDAQAAIARHATSKIRQPDDLNKVTTLGFRGEALAAIAAVSRFTLLTKTPDAVAGTRVVVEGGEIKEVVPVGCPQGTQVIVEDLFFNSLPRRKFLKSDRSESGAIADVITRYALGYPEIAFHYTSGKRQNLVTSGNDDLLEIASILYGKESRGQFIQVSYAEEGIEIKGLISDPGFTRASRYYQSFFVNKRLIRNYLLSRTLENAYQGLITSGHYPCAVIFLNIDTRSIDVNVHPTKSDIRFSDAQLVARILYHGLRNALTEYLQQQRQPDHFFQDVRDVQDADQPSTKQEHIPQHQERALFTQQTQHYTKPALVKDGFSERLHKKENRDEELPVRQTFFQKMRLLGQVQGTYIIAEDGNAVYIIDQHAAHERVRYEEILGYFKQRKKYSQKICPEPIQLTPEEAVLYTENSEFFTQIGYTLQKQENNSYLLISVPWGQHTNPEQLFKELLDLIRQANEEVKSVDLHQKAVTMMACKSALKAGDSLTDEEMKQLLAQLDATAHPDRCPHGRPTYVEITNKELTKWFYR
ncbi:MAG: DNA mismatch repair endonuclease MutL [Syntrophaceticus sp.]|nr:DNA mismatch repair endonuclease MutL [Syntrophaceticus sp.]MDD3313963.1 DNA mismatch repair endonuclease MutL [Syntrophaceticus sp.]MDD4359040.1 DNA mismatch repair endonuclease MutL [Syntrophaceticus sp.]MDD4782644.1 DNA mismatch repair endonuclease MutL [Syntrophaceticus sp.]